MVLSPIVRHGDGREIEAVIAGLSATVFGATVVTVAGWLVRTTADRDCPSRGWRSLWWTFGDSLVKCP